MAHDDNRVRVRVTWDGNGGFSSLPANPVSHVLQCADITPSITPTPTTQDAVRDRVLYAEDSSGNPVELAVVGGTLLIQVT